MEKEKDLALGEAIREQSANWIQRNSSGSSLVTVTGVEVYNRGRRARILVTVMPENQEKAVMDFLKRNVADMRSYIGKNIKSHAVPFLDVDIDIGTKNLERIDELLAKK